MIIEEYELHQLKNKIKILENENESLKKILLIISQQKELAEKLAGLNIKNTINREK